MTRRRRWSVTPVSGGWMSVDGGTLFGIVPKMIWGKLLPPDRKNRVRIPCRCLLARRGKETVLIDTGYGGKTQKRQRRSFLLEDGNPIFGALAREGVRPEDVTHVVMTHLHFDHAGGATCFDERENLVPAFPQARYWASRTEWQDAIEPISALRGAYPRENIAPLVERNLDGTFEDGDEILAGLTMQITGGHTRGHAAARLDTEEGPILFIGELAPTRWHAKELWTSAFDTYPLDTRAVKPKIFTQAIEQRMAIYWSHDPGAIASRPIGMKGNDCLTEELL